MIYNNNKNNSAIGIKKNLIYLGQTIGDALKIIQSSDFKICLVLDNKSLFKGVINDGDIRRALIRGKEVNSKIDDIYKKNPFIIKENYSENEVLKKLAFKGISEAPIIKNQKVLGILAIKKTIHQESEIPVVIMCGGFGKRLRPITMKKPKALVKINNVPMMSLVINNIKKYGFLRFILSTNYKSNLIKKYYKNGKLLNVKIKYIKEKKPLGTAGSLSLLKKKINKKYFILTNCDVISDINYKNLLDFHIKNKADCTIAVKKIKSENLYGEINLKGFYVNKIIEKPTKDIIINTAIYVLSTKCIKLLKYNQKTDMNDFIMKLLNKNKKVIAFPFLENWYDLGAKEDLKVFKSFES